MGKNYTKTAPAKSSEQLALDKLDELVAAMKALTAKIDADSGDTGGDNDYAASITDSLKSASEDLAE